MNKQKIRRQQREVVQRSYEQLQAIVRGDFSPGYFNRPDVLAAEQIGLSVADGVLGYVLDAAKDHGLEERALELLRRVEASLVPEEATNQCHNLAAAVTLFLDRIGCPAVTLLGTLEASAPGSKGFILNAAVEPPNADVRPGHSWVLTPYWWVADVSLAFQADAGDDHERLSPLLPSLLVETTRELSEPLQEWWRLPGGGPPMPRRAFAMETKYHDVLGWSQVNIDDLVLRYLPGAALLPEETDLNEVYVRFGGLLAGDFFDAHLADLRG